MMIVQRYIAFRFLLLPATDSLYHQPVSEAQKLEWFRDIFFRNTEFSTSRGTHYAVRGVEAQGMVATGKLSRKKLLSIYEDQQTDIQERIIEDWPYLEFFCDATPEVQLLVIRYLSQIAQNENQIAEVLSAIVNREMWHHGYTAHFHPIVDQESFWDVIDNSDGVFRIQFRLTSPNLFGANESARHALTEIRDVFNNTSVRIDLESDRAQLQTPRDRIDHFRDYADKGGGSWEVKVKKGRRKRVIRSSDRAAKVSIEFEDTEEGVDALKRAFQRFLAML